MPESRKRKPKRKPAQPRRSPGAAAGIVGPFQLMDDRAAARAIRRFCPVCASPVEWMSLSLASRLARLPEQRAAATGFIVEQGLPAGSEFWACTRCDEYGAFGPMGDEGTALAPWGL